MNFLLTKYKWISGIGFGIIAVCFLILVTFSTELYDSVGVSIEFILLLLQSVIFLISSFLKKENKVFIVIIDLFTVTTVILTSIGFIEFLNSKINH